MISSPDLGPFRSRLIRKVNIESTFSKDTVSLFKLASFAAGQGLWIPLTQVAKLVTIPNTKSKSDLCYWKMWGKLIKKGGNGYTKLYLPIYFQNPSIFHERICPLSCTHFETRFKLALLVAWNDVVSINPKENFEQAISLSCVKYVNSGNKRSMMSCVLATNRCSLSLSRTTPHDPLLCSCHEHKPVGKITNLVVKNLLSWVIKVFTVEQTHNHWLNYEYKKDLRRCYLWWHFLGWFIVFVHDYHILSHVGFVLILKPPFVSSPFALLFSDDNECEKFSSNNTSRFS